ncbi:low-affinity glucose transporter protein rag1 [Borealophlyctis nickersoniae]|nr:low-affinity glucose transporter protein rag1 [Borealophlyctis nickersoniae]
MEGLKRLCVGVKKMPLFPLSTNILNFVVDATHADINVSGIFIEMVYQWELHEGSDEKTQVQAAQNRLRQTLASSCHVQSHMMMQGNYGRAILSNQQCEKAMLPLIPNPNEQLRLQQLLRKFENLRRVWRATEPDMREVKLQPTGFSRYKLEAVGFGEFLREHFGWADWPNYMHMLLERVDELIRQWGTVGGLASEGNEGSNRVHRLVEKGYSRSNGANVRDILKWMWLRSSPLLAVIGEPEKAEYECSACGRKGRNCRSCPYYLPEVNPYESDSESE